VADDTRISDLERRLQVDPTSIAFAQLAEEYRRSGQLDEAIRVCRAGLAWHPSHPSARVTLGRALLAQGRQDEARIELEAAAAAAPDHTVAARALDEFRRAAAGHPVPARDQLALQELEGWLAAVVDDRTARRRNVPGGQSPQP
jgi:tetratricopeptide (TPR) repeat protein